MIKNDSYATIREIFPEKFSLKNCELFKVWQMKHFEVNKRAAVYAHFQSFINENGYFENIEQYLKEQFRIFYSNMIRRRRKSGRGLKGNYLLKIGQINPAPINSKSGLPQLIFSQKSERAKRRVANINQNIKIIKLKP